MEKICRPTVDAQDQQKTPKKYYHDPLVLALTEKTSKERFQERRDKMKKNARDPLVRFHKSTVV